MYIRLGSAAEVSGRADVLGRRNQVTITGNGKANLEPSGKKERRSEKERGETRREEETRRG